MSDGLFRALNHLAGIRGTTLEHEVARHNIRIVEAQRLRPPLQRPSTSEAERVAREKASRARSVEKARAKRMAASKESALRVGE
jgi:hypothetical protein